jgi:hypothetical protein
MFRHFKYKVIPLDLQAKVYVEGKDAFNFGRQRGHNPYTRNNLALATIWWHGWDTEDEESNVDRKPSGDAHRS